MHPMFEIMKKTLLAFCLLAFMYYPAFSQVVNYDQIERRSRVAYLKGTNEPFTGTAKSYYKNAAVKNEISFVNGLRDGNFKVFYESGKIKSVKIYKANGLEGEVIVWYENGQLERRVMFSNDKRNGMFQTWYENGQLKSKGEYISNKKTGIHTGWYDDGKKESEGNFVDDNPEGPHSEWFRSGQLSAEITYRGGEEISAKYWNEEGKLLSPQEVEELMKMRSGNLMQMWLSQDE
jgi:antitoxin component YwqK of YwqJK toxin-antitoxin module